MPYRFPSACRGKGLGQEIKFSKMLNFAGL
jgi:hypothetical protein